MTGSDGISTYSQDLVVINAMMRGDQRIVGNRELSEDERWLYRIGPGSDAPRPTGSLPPIRPSRSVTSQACDPHDRGVVAAPQPQARHRWPRPYEVAAGACASAAATGVVGGLGIGGTMIGAAVTSLVIALGGALFTRWFSRTHRSVSGAHQRRGMWARMVAVALVVSVLTVVVGVVWLASSAGQKAGWWVHRATGSLEQWRESAQRAWPYLRKAWNAFR
ncbi:MULTISPECIES: hypothetical protein [Cutibacterium]|nr:MULTISPECIES: hypothetical protein [Cutibacterium]OFJ81485.1 hypothetical protein HMPREF2841_07110 [Propionibacterium sp. HMSC065F07]AER06520.1 hypothetical protein TIIST44_10325 [Cutibacterium acnes subsp. defendens ATCC 11828]ALD69477.1 hypothetical protein RN83_04685 [Cutibacterium acnes]ALU23243.1 hypothetical protein VO62_04020 [Cutibacterium acnes]EFB89025.1 hypothetical protein HMPREF9206_2138 [Cutibacterium acnes J139]